jgi:hypothetical protein
VLRGISYNEITVSPTVDHNKQENAGSVLTMSNYCLRSDGLQDIYASSVCSDVVYASYLYKDSDKIRANDGNGMVVNVERVRRATRVKWPKCGDPR